MNCTHKRGDFIHGMWVCAICFTPLQNGRPVKYGIDLPSKKMARSPQIIVWQAEIAKGPDGVAFSKFVKWMVSYLRMRSAWTLSKDEARQLCLEVLREMGEPFGSSDASWGKEDAKELVREGICAYWDEGPSGINT